jgi:hypothetical protein
MIFDRELCFVYEGEIQDFPGGPVGDVIDLGADKQLYGRDSYVAIQCFQDMTATGDPVVKLGLEFSEDKEFTDPVAVPLSLPELSKENFKAGRVIVARSPLYSNRFVRLLLDTDIDVTCAKFNAGFVLDAQTNDVDM